MLTTEILSGGEEIVCGLADEWASLCEEGASNEPFLRPEWFAAFVKNFGCKVEIITVRRDGKLRALLPLMRSRSTLHGVPVRKIEAVYNLNTQRFDLIHGADEAEKHAILRLIWKAIQGQPGWDVVEMRLVKKDSWLADLLAVAENASNKTGVWEMDAAPLIALPSATDPEMTINEFLKGSRKHLRQQLDRRTRRLNEIGSVEHVVTREYSPDLLERYFELETKGWKGRQGTAVTDDAAVSRLHHDFAAAVSDNGALYAYELRLDGKTIAMSLNILCGGRMVHWKTSYDEEYSRYSPGNLLFKKLVTDCMEAKICEIDLLSPATANKRFWATGEREHAAFYIFNRGLAGMLLHKWKFTVVSGLRGFKSGSPGALIPAHAAK
jgi:CelD/BcsL family acetyltransferase involved in cellulose biosynthesis